MSFCVGEPVEIVGGEYAGLGGVIEAIYPGGCEVTVGGYRLPIALADLAPDLLHVTWEALAEIERLGGDPQIIARLIAVLNRRPVFPR